MVEAPHRCVNKGLKHGRFSSDVAQQITKNPTSYETNMWEFFPRAEYVSGRGLPSSPDFLDRLIISGSDVLGACTAESRDNDSGPLFGAEGG